MAEFRKSNTGSAPLMLAGDTSAYTSATMTQYAETVSLTAYTEELAAKETAVEEQTAALEYAEEMAERYNQSRETDVEPPISAQYIDSSTEESGTTSSGSGTTSNQATDNAAAASGSGNIDSELSDILNGDSTGVAAPSAPTANHSFGRVRQYDVSANVYLNGKEIPGVSATVSYALDGIPVAEIRPALGTQISRRGVSKLKKADFSEGSTLKIVMRYGKRDYLLFDGLVASVGGTRVNSQQTGASMVVRAVHKLYYLSGMPAGSRYHTAAGGQDIIDLYQTKAASFLTTGFNKDLGIFNPEAATTLDTGAYLKLLLATLFLSEKDHGIFRETDTQGMAMLKALRVPYGLKLPESMAAVRAEFAEFATQHLGQAWLQHNAWDIMVSYLKLRYACMAPYADGAYMLPDMSCLKAPWIKMKSSNIFGVNRSFEVSTRRVAAVAVRNMRVAFDAFKNNNPETPDLTSTVWPPSGRRPPGMVLYMPMPPWAQQLYNMNLQWHKAPITVVRGSETPGGVPGNDRADDPANAALLDRWQLLIAQSEFGARVWRGDQMELSIPFNPSLCPGTLLGLTVADEGYASMFGNESLVGFVREARVHVSPGSFDMSVRLDNVRTKAKSETYGFSRHPFFSDASPKPLALFPEA